MIIPAANMFESIYVTNRDGNISRYLKDEKVCIASPSVEYELNR